ncbi:MAG: SpoIIE family protein phosphatase [Acidimicrobiales bacterium]
MPAALAADDAWLSRYGAATEVGRLVAAFDWSSTPLGPPDAWPVELRVAVQMCLTTRFPMLIMWGPDLRMIYNGAYREITGDKHPAALGARVQDVFPEIWDTIGPMARQVMESAEPTWSEHEPLLINRSGFLEDTRFIWSYSPLIASDGTVTGVVDIVSETTAQVHAQRRLAGLSQLGAALFDAIEVAEVCRRSIEVLAGWDDDVVDAHIHLRRDDDLDLVASGGGAGGPIARDRLAEVTERGVAHRFVGEGHRPGQPVDAVALPLGGVRGGPRGALVIEPAPTLGFDAEHAAFIAAVASTIGTAIESAHRREVELGEHRRISETLQAAMLQPASPHVTVAARYRAAEESLAAGGDWYDVIDLGQHRSAMVVGDCVGHGLAAAATMGQLRSALRAYLLQGHGPAAALEHLDLFAASTPGAFAATVVCAVIDREQATLTYARAGHPPPVLGHGDTTRWLDEGLSVPIQVAVGRERQQAVLSYAEGSLLVLYSDGLVERRTESIDVGLGRLEAAVGDLSSPEVGVEQAADRILASLLRDSPPQDDVVLVAKRLRLDRALP